MPTYQFSKQISWEVDKNQSQSIVIFASTLLLHTKDNRLPKNMLSVNLGLWSSKTWNSRWLAAKQDLKNIVYHITISSLIFLFFSFSGKITKIG